MVVDKTVGKVAILVDKGYWWWWGEGMLVDRWWLWKGGRDGNAS